jgi:hypothetical protein
LNEIVAKARQVDELVTGLAGSRMNRRRASP